MELEKLGFWELIKLDFAIDIEFLSRYWIWIVVTIFTYILFMLILD